MELKGKNVLVIGLAKSGIAAAIELFRLGALVTATDIKTKNQFKDIEKLKPFVKEIVLGKHPLRLLENCDLIVVSPGVPNEIDLLKEARNKSIPIISELELGFWFTKAPIIAITGTNGKTTTTTLVGEILKNSGKNIVVAGNIGMPFVKEIEHDDSRDYIVLEVSSFQLDNIMNFKPRISVILNISEDHLNWHNTFENYVRAKSKIFKNQEKEDYTVVNADDPMVLALAEKSKGNLIYFSTKKELPYGVFVKNNVIVIKQNGNILPILEVNDLRLKGKHNLENALAAVAISWIVGVNLNNLAETLKEFPGVEHRLEYVTTINGIHYINDSKGTNPEAAMKAIESVEGSVILIAGGYNKNTVFDNFVRAFGNKVKHLILMGDTAIEIQNAAKKQGFDKITIVDSMEQAVYEAAKFAKPGYTVLLSPACASWDMFESFEERGHIFKEVVYSLKQ